jgi:hypothetical protein
MVDGMVSRPFSAETLGPTERADTHPPQIL